VVLSAGLGVLASGGLASCGAGSGRVATPPAATGQAPHGGGTAPVRGTVAAPSVTVATTRPTTAAPTPTTTDPPAPPVNLALPGCPPPPYHGPPPPPPWHPATLVPDAALPTTPAPLPRRASLTPIVGKGMWIWEFGATDSGNAAAVVAAARAAGLHQLWVRVADSQSGFYGAPVLDQLLPVAHLHGLAVIGWGFPHLYDPVGDARWTEAALAWRSPAGDRLDGYSADIETPSEGVDLTARRAALYLALVRRADPTALLVATVFPPTDLKWGSYPYAAMAPYIDAFAPMVYWGCTEPVLEAEQALQRLGPLAPVHLIGQAYDMAGYGGRVGPPTPAEITAFMQAARRYGALGASLWSWQAIDPADWGAMSRYAWPAPG
jgi:hypothetical protein